uniref:Uncharacterized protein n=1 Tax=Ceratitis capitata TaxID=7213 RepID=W8AY01_CERCA
MRVHTTKSKLQFLVLKSKAKVKTKTWQQRQQRRRLIKFSRQPQLQQNRQILRQLKLLKQTVIFECTPPVAEALKQQLQRQKKQHQYLRNNKREHSLLKTRQNSLQLKHSKLACVELTDLLLLCCQPVVNNNKVQYNNNNNISINNNNNSCSGVESKAKDDDAVPVNKSKLNSLRRRD